MEQNLINEIIEGDENAFRKVYDLYKRKVYKTIIASLNDEKAAEDILQEVFIIVFTKIRKLRSAEAFESWLYRTTLNCCKSYYRKHKNDLYINDDSILENLQQPQKNNTENVILNMEVNNELKQCINKMPVHLKECVILFYFSEMSICEIAQIEGCTQGAVKSRLFKGRKYIKDKLNLEIQEGDIGIYEF